MKSVLLSIGSNLGDRVGNLNRAIQLISKKGMPTIRVSSFYDTEPWGCTEQPSFMNAALEVGTTMHPRELLSALKEIESDMGREDGIKWGPRLIDIDILFYGQEIVDYPELIIPHPLIHKRSFVLVPLAEIAPDFVHPLFDRDVKTLLEELIEKDHQH